MHRFVLAIVAAVAIIMAAVAFAPSPAAASPATPLLIAQSAPADIVATSAENLDVSCLTSTTTITWATTNKSVGVISCWVDGATPVFFGARGVLAANGIPICEDVTCADGGRGIWKSPVTNNSVFGCISSSGTKHAICTVTFP